MKAIGGYFELELRKGAHYHSEALRLNTGRNCLEYILRCRGYEHIYVPYYGCEVMLEPIQKLSIRYSFYRINEQLEPVDYPVLQDKEAFFYTNYYALKDECVARLAEHYGSQLIVDNAQAFFAEPLPGIDTFYTARKFFGVADGAYLYLGRDGEEAKGREGEESRVESRVRELPLDESWNRMSHSLMRIDGGAQFGFEDFHRNNGSLHNQEIKRMSRLTEAILESVDYNEAMHIRKENFRYLHEHLGKTNGFGQLIKGDELGLDYPYYVEDDTLRQRLIENKIFVAKLWPNISEWCQPNEWEWKLMNYTFHLPIDQRYDLEDMKRIVEVLNIED